MKLRNDRVFLALCFLFCTPTAWALGLGDARVQSFIGQPLEMRIELLTSASDDLDSVTVRLASADDFARIGASREAISVPLQFSVREGDAGAYILVTSRLGINDPVLRLVVEVNWSSGRLLREYTVFLDPPTLPARAPRPDTARSERQAAPVSAPTEQPAEAAATQPAAAPQADVSAPAPGAAAEGEAEAEDAPLTAAEPAIVGESLEGGAYGPVRNGETLWRIASDFIGESGMDMNQVMLAIQRRNPDAFMNDNINLLKRGATLEMPTANEVSELSRDRARELVAQHEAAFRMRASLASTSTPLVAAESKVDSADPLPAEEGPAPEETTLSRLEIVPTSEEDLSAGQPGTGAVPAGEGSEEVEGELREELARTEEELFSERQQNEYLRERISELEAQLAETEREAEGLVPDEELATLEDRLQSERLAEAEAAQEAPAPVDRAAPSAMPSVTTTPPVVDDRPWYSGALIWIIMTVIVIAAVVGWYLQRRRAVEYDLSAMAGSGTVASGLRGDAEEILRTLDADRQQAEVGGAGGQQAAGYRTAPDDAAPPAAKRVGTGGWDEVEIDDEMAVPEGEEDTPPVVQLERARRYRSDDTADARVLDENSSDPEIKLDLARAYISMGDKEAARVILGEVLNIGDDVQCAEARSMMDEL